MAISTQVFPPRKRRPSAGSFISPNFSDMKLVQSLVLLSQDISGLKPFRFLLKRSSLSIIRKAKLLAILFEEILRMPVFVLPRSAILCFEEIHILLQRIKTLLEDCSNGSKMWLLMQVESVSNNFHELMIEVSTLLDIFPLKEFELSEDVKDMVCLIRKQCWERKVFVDPNDKNLRFDVLKLLDQIKREIVPDQLKLEYCFEKLGLADSISCRDEIESLEEELQNHQICEKSTVETIALIGLVRYAKCVLFGASTPRNESSPRSPTMDTTFPVDFRCPISLDLMRDPVVVATGQTYDRSSISHWIESGHNTCPKTGQLLDHTNLIPNRALRNLISLWCRQQKIPFEITKTNYRVNGCNANKTALEAVKMTALFLISKLSMTSTNEDANRLVYELRLLAKMDPENRACIAEAGAIPWIVKHLNTDNSNLQVNAVTTMLNLSLLESNKKRIMETNGAIDGVIEVLRSGATWEAKENAAATIFCLSGVSEYRKKLGRKTRVLKGLLDLAKVGPSSAKKDAMLAILNLASERDAIGRLIDGGVVEMAVEVVEEMPEEAVALLAMVAKKGGVVAIVAAFQAVRTMAVVLRDGPERARESAAAALVSVCRRGGAEVVAELAATLGIERAIWELMASGTNRARRKAASLLRILRRWANGNGMEHHTVAFPNNVVAARTALHS